MLENVRESRIGKQNELHYTLPHDNIIVFNTLKVFYTRKLLNATRKANVLLLAVKFSTLVPVTLQRRTIKTLT